MKNKKEQAAQPAKERKRGSALVTAGKFITAAIVLLVLFWFGFTCEVREGNCAVIMRFGAVREEITDAGVYLKLPWPFETVVTYDARLQYLESNKLETTTGDKRNIIFQSYVVWQIEDPVRYHNTVGTQGTADSFIRNQVFDATNNTLGKYNLTQLVSLEAEQLKIDQIQQEICQLVQQKCAKDYGIRVSDVSILRLSLPDTNLESVFQQMRADRQKEIDAILAEATLEANKITTEAAQESAQIIADGTTQAAAIKAETEMEVAKIYAEAQSADIELYRFLMELDVLASSVNDTTVLVVNADEYPFNILTKYSSSMSAEGDATVIEDLSYILTKLPEKERKDLLNALSGLIERAAKNNGVELK